MRTRAVAALAGAAATLALYATATAGLSQSRSGAYEIASRPIEAFRIGSTETRFGPLEFIGGLEMTSSARDFGSLSAFRFRGAGTEFVGVTDTGFWYFGVVARDESGTPVGFADFSMEEMVDRHGRPIRDKMTTDAEGIAILGDVATVSFERKHRVSEFDVERGVMRAARRDLDFVIPRHELRQNKGIETVAHAPADGPLAGARVVVSERSIDEKGDIFAAIMEGPRRGVFKIRRGGGFDITDGAFLPDGDLLLLERSFNMAEGVRMRLRRLQGEDIRPGARLDGDILFEADMAYQIDNMEGLDTWVRPDGATMVSIVSDDNHSILQRNLYLEFRLVE
ncbi:MAG: esterase-like activity of phytase family protein [Rhizobiaceae bacterium]|nr:esterase-like activity of phytase family protein [Rhizobiaceae bacterium]MCV0407609.1 esterase-like activity of phytase family protein [Rhizobiaceae bacterium]